MYYFTLVGGQPTGTPTTTRPNPAPGQSSVTVGVQCFCPPLTVTPTGYWKVMKIGVNGDPNSICPPPGSPEAPPLDPQKSKSIRGRVWHDDNQDGSIEVGEDAINAAHVELREAGPDGVLGTSDDTVYSQVTESNGVFSFEELPPGTYELELVTSSLPAGFSLVTGPAPVLTLPTTEFEVVWEQNFFVDN